MLSNSVCQDCTDTNRNTGAYILFYHCVPTDHCTNFPVPFANSSAENDYNAACAVGMAVAHSIILNIEFLNKGTYEVP